ncbi:thioredoxin family protein [Acanthopleuribacter pedis]|uniref:Thioredoxin family protein n=1 Tax=Acanthopleuribacter pedis TaxID=442870 RepID=A0A8J7QCD4_9BACT|nr:thioredoxin fold domain-containing protein [Acanthopleuribacter pedis]MBO1316955.1 thioredoxin family protein [Acanthopleuribacter pedis]
MLTTLFIGLLLNDTQFFKGSVDDLFSTAKEQQKVVVVDVYTEWCGPCKLMDRNTWSNEKVLSFLTENAVSMKIDAEKGEGQNFAKKYKVAGYPCILIFNSEGELIDRRMGYLPPREFLNWANSSLE